MKFTRPLAFVSTLGVAALLAMAAASPAPAPYTVTLSDAHVCCGSCVKGATAAVASLKDVKADASIDKKTIVVTAPDKATAQKAMDLLTNAGYYGKSSSADIKVNGVTGAKDEKVASVEVDNLHLCCGSCVTAVNDILAKLPGFKSSDVKAKATSFTVVGEINPKDLFDAFQKAGLTGKAGATKPIEKKS